MAYITNNETQATSSVFAKIGKFFKNIGISMMNAQEARARQHVKEYMKQINRPL